MQLAQQMVNVFAATVCEMDFFHGIHAVFYSTLYTIGRFKPFPPNECHHGHGLP